MKRLFPIITLVAALGLFSFCAAPPAAKSFEGKITYDIFYPEDQGGAQLEGELVYYLKGNKSRLEQPMGSGMKQIVLSDHDKKTRKILLNFMGKKICISMDETEFVKMEEGKLIPEIAYTKEKKEIGGMACKKATCTFFDEGKKKELKVFYCPSISNKLHGEFPGLKGFPLDYESIISGMPVRLVAKSVTKQEVSEDLFAISDEYEEMTMEELQQTMQGQ